MVDFIHHGDMAMAGEAFTADGMTLSGIHFILTGDLMVVGVMEAAGPTAVAGVMVAPGASALDMDMVMEDSTNLIIISTITIITITTV